MIGNITQTLNFEVQTAEMKNQQIAQMEMQNDKVRMDSLLQLEKANEKTRKEKEQCVKYKHLGEEMEGINREAVEKLDEFKKMFH